MLSINDPFSPISTSPIWPWSPSVITLAAEATKGYYLNVWGHGKGWYIR